MLILDTSEIQARKPDPQAREISRLTWDNASIPQNAIPFTRDGKPYVLEFDEYTQATLEPDGNPDAVGAGADHRHLRRDASRASSRTCACRSTSPPTTRPPSGDPGTSSPAAGLRGALLQHPDARRTRDRRVLVHRLGPARLRHLRPAAPEGDRLLRRARRRRRRRTATTAATTRCRSRRSRPRATRSGTPTAPAASTSCASRTGCGLTTRRPSAKRCRKTARPKRTSARAHRHRSAKRTCARRERAHA